MRDFAAYIQQYKADPSRLPAGKGMVHIYAFALVECDIQHIGFYSWQLGSNRPVPGWGQYKSPVPKLYMTGGSTHPGGGVTGAPGRNATQVVMEDLGLDFDALIG